MANKGSKDDDKKPGININFDDGTMLDVSSLVPSDEEISHFRERVSKMFGKGNIYVDGLDKFKDDLYGSPPSMASQRRANLISSCPYIPGTDSMRDGVAKLIWECALMVWEHPIEWQFSVTYNFGQDLWWFTARYYDEEEGEVLVHETLEITAESVVNRWDQFDADLERLLIDMHDKCIADLEMFK